MGKSVFMLSAGTEALNRAQMRRLRNELGSGALGMEGPFSDRRGAIEEIADHVRSRTRRSSGSDEIKTAMFTLAPQDLLPDGLPPSYCSSLETPFVTGHPDHCGAAERESAGETASSATVDFRGAKARRASLEELTVLGVAVLRKLGIESFYSVCHFDAQVLNRVLENFGAEVVLPPLPAVVVPMGERLAMTAVVPQALDPRYSLPISSLELLDPDALLSFIKMRNSVAYARALMEDVGGRGPEFNGEGNIRAMQVGHTLFEAETLWTLLCCITAPQHSPPPIRQLHPPFNSIALASS